MANTNNSARPQNDINIGPVSVNLITPTRQNSSGNWIDLWLKVIPIGLSIGGFIFGIYQFNEQQEQRAREEFDRRMFENTLESYSKVSQIVGKMTTLTLPKDTLIFDSLQTAFNERYWGSLLLVQQDTVRKALRGLKAEIGDVRHNRGEMKNILLRQDYLAEQFRSALKTYRNPED